MKVLLIQPPVRDFYRTSIRTKPIGLAYLASSLQFDGHEVEILDCQTEKKTSSPIPSEMSYLKDFYPIDDRSPFKLYTGFYHFGMGWDEIRKEIEASRADVFGISSSFTPYYGEALKVAQLIKESDSKRIVALGGSHVSCDPEGVLKSPWVDYIILGEGERRFPALVEQIQRGRGRNLLGIDGVGYRTDGEIRIHPLQGFIQDLDSLPFPERGLLDQDRYRINRKRSTMLITSRGCPHGCAYCSAHLVMGSSFRGRSPENILQEMIACHQEYGIDAFDVEDDNFTFDFKRAKELMTRIIKTFGEGRFELSAMNGVSFASLDRELLSLMKRSGFRTLNLSYVSTDLSTKKRMKRPQSEADFDRILKEAEAVGLNVVAYAILGIPGQTLEEMVSTLVYLMEQRVLIGPSVYYPVPGTSLFYRCKEDGILPSDFSQWRSSALSIETNEFNRLDMATLLRLARVINFIKGKMDRRELEEGVTWEELLEGLPERAGAEVKDGIPTWRGLLLMLFRERSFFSLRKMPGNGFSIQKEGTSKKVLDHFFEMAKEKPILRSRND